LIPQVFISHTGQDERARVFACSILEPALKAANVPVYIDYNNLEAGDIWPAELMNAAANSQVVVVVLSRSYVQRYWCMLELDLALHWRQRHGCTAPRLIPVFVDSPDAAMDGSTVLQFWEQVVLPADPQQQEQQQQQQLAKLRQRPAKELSRIRPAAWGSNVTAVRRGEFQNLRLENCKGKDAEAILCRQVVQCAVRHMPQLLAIPSGLYGVEEQQARLLSELYNRQGLWLHGLGERCYPAA
jgi:hypothetical protein